MLPAASRVRCGPRGGRIFRDGGGRADLANIGTGDVVYIGRQVCGVRHLLCVAGPSPAVTLPWREMDGGARGAGGGGLPPLQTLPWREMDPIMSLRG